MNKLKTKLFTKEQIKERLDNGEPFIFPSKHREYFFKLLDELQLEYTIKIIPTKNKGLGSKIEAIMIDEVEE